MSKYCGNCGAKMTDDAKVCGNCGTPFVESLSKDSDKKQITYRRSDPEKARKVQKGIKLGLIAIVIVAVAAMAINIVVNYTGYNGLLKKTMNAYKDYDIETLVELSSDMYFSGTDDLVEYYFKNAVGVTLDSFESKVGHNYSFKYETEDTYKLSDRKVDEMLNSISNTYSAFDVDIIEEIVVADVKVTASRDKSKSSKVIQVTMSKENGEWRILYIGQ